MIALSSTFYLDIVQIFLRWYILFGMKQFALHLKRIREGRGLSKGQVAAYCGVDRSTIGNLESGRRWNPSMGTLVKLSEGLKIDIVELLEMAGLKGAYKKPSIPDIPVEIARMIDELIFIIRKAVQQEQQFLSNLLEAKKVLESLERGEYLEAASLDHKIKDLRDVEEVFNGKES